MANQVNRSEQGRDGQNWLVESGAAYAAHSHDQDAHLVSDRLGLYAVFDGLALPYWEGSRKAANLGSLALLKVFNRQTKPLDPNQTSSLLVNSLDSIHRQLSRRNRRVNGLWCLPRAEQAYQRSCNRGGKAPERFGKYRPGATTAVVAKLMAYDDELYLVWAAVGDSLMAVKEGSEPLYALSVDEVSATGRPANCLGIGAIYQGVKQASIEKISAPGQLVLTSDGVHASPPAPLPLARIDYLLSSSPDPNRAAQTMVNQAMTSDDRTAIVVSYRPA